MALDPAAQALLEQMAAAEMPPLNEMSPVEAREMAQGFLELAGPGEDVADVTERSIPGPAGDITVRIITPKGTPNGPLPCLVYYHGGGWVIGDLNTVDTTCRALANKAGVKIVSVDYRLSPEHKFPAPVEDCYAALQWVASKGQEIGVDTSRIAVGGDSAGGNLAAAVAIRCRDEGGPRIAFQLLVYPVTDHSFDTRSYQDNADGYLLTKDMMVWFWDHYLGNDEEGKNPWASPLRAEDLSGLPPALVITAEYDPLRDEGEAFAERLAQAGVPVTRTRYDGQIHAFWQMPLVFASAHQAIGQAADELRRVLGLPPRQDDEGFAGASGPVG
jgi:acetyl esterase